MLNLKHVVRLFAVIFVAVTMLAATAAQSDARTGAVRLRIVKAGFIVGVGGGNGVPRYQGRTYPLTIGGVGIGSLGVAAVNLVGTATNLQSPTDIAGTYGAAGAGATFVGGAQVATLQNEKGVVLRVRGVQAGFQVSLGLAGMTIALK
jgi:hypothetical protein